MPLPRTPNSARQAEIVLPYDHPSPTANTDLTVKRFKVPSGKKFRLDRVDYNNPTGLVANASNYYVIKVLKGATVMAQWSTQTGAEGTLSADTPVTLTLAASDADRVAAADDVISVMFDATGTVTLPAGVLHMHGRWV